ncbi:hypothetical protein BAC1_00862 [uncultured bacterium]|nr:MAG: DUF4124 domain-containing protein [Burkholderiales bacterium]CAG1065283.1 hypothetical protein BAC1_00862 [uncultured bacterium]
MDAAEPNPTRFSRPLGALLGASCLAFASVAWADICKYVDAEGRVIYSNLPVKGAKRLSCDVTLDAGSNGGKSARNAPSPAGFPKVDGATQKGRDDLRRKVLVEELAAEEKLFAEARGVYREGTPERLSEELGNDAKYRERVAKLKQNLAVHEKNVAALKQELAKIK